MSEDGGSGRRLGALRFAVELLTQKDAEYEPTEIAIVTAIVRRGMAVQPNTTDEACFVSDDWISEHTRASARTVRRALAKHCSRKRPVVGRSWPGRTWGTDDRWHQHDCERYTLLRTDDQVAEAVRLEHEHVRIERRRSEKRQETREAREHKARWRDVRRHLPRRRVG